MKSKFENHSEKTYNLNDARSKVNIYENICKKVRIAYTTAFSNLYIGRKKFEKLLFLYEVSEFQEDIKKADDMRTYKSSHQISDMLDWLRFHKRNSASIDMGIKDFYITACTRTPIFVADTRLRIQRHVQGKVYFSLHIILNTTL